MNTLELFTVGKFRIAVPATRGPLRWEEGFAVLDSAIQDAINQVRALPYASLLAPSQSMFPERPGPRMADREGVVDVMLEGPDERGEITVLVRGTFPVKGWPFGRWVKWGGLLASPDGQYRPLSRIALAEVW
ncbi:MAG: hypothetical protein JNL44_15860 [Gemmatimonadetes bacterium]|nr:hypothetical protein [Gemmatimonadota bacterium]